MCIRSFFPRYFIMSLCSSTRLRMGTDAWRGFGRQACSASGTAFFNICRQKVGYMRFSRNTTRRFQNATTKAAQIALLYSCWRRSVKHWICIYSNQAQQTHRSANMSGDCSMRWNPALYPKPQKLSVRILKRSLSDERSQRL